MRIGDLSKRVTLQSPSAGQDPVTGEPMAGWVDLAVVWASILYLTGDETIKSSAPLSVVKASIRIRYRNDVVANMRVIMGPAVFDIRAVMPDEARREYVDLVVEAGGNNG